MYAKSAKPDSCWFVGKVLAVDGRDSSAKIKFKDGWAWLQWSVVEASKPVDVPEAQAG